MYLDRNNRVIMVACAQMLRNPNVKDSYATDNAQLPLPVLRQQCRLSTQRYKRNQRYKIGIHHYDMKDITEGHSNQSLIPARNLIGQKLFSIADFLKYQGTPRT
jgi:hypothetical protein